MTIGVCLPIAVYLLHAIRVVAEISRAVRASKNDWAT